MPGFYRTEYAACHAEALAKAGERREKQSQSWVGNLSAWRLKGINGGLTKSRCVGLERSANFHWVCVVCSSVVRPARGRLCVLCVIAFDLALSDQLTASSYTADGVYYPSAVFS